MQRFLRENAENEEVDLDQLRIGVFLLIAMTLFL